MRNHRLFVLFIITVAPLANLATRASSPWDEIHVKHTWDAVPINWESLGSPPAGTTIDLHIALKPHRESALIDALYEVSDPKHPKYGAHLSQEQVAELVALNPKTLELVNSWLEHYGVPSSSISASHGGGWLTVTGMLVSQANELLGASYQLYRRAGTNDTTILRTVGYALPTVLHTHVQTVAPTTNFASMHTPRQTPRRRFVRAAASLASAAASGELATLLPRSDDDSDGDDDSYDSDDSDDEVTPHVLRWLYNTVAYEPVAMDQNAIGIAGFLDEYPSQEDLAMFMEVGRTDAEDATFSVVQINEGGYDASHPSYEANLNIQYAQAMAYPTPLVFYSTGGTMRYSSISKEPTRGDMFLEWLNYMLAQQNIPQTISTSFGADEKDVPLEYATTVCELFAQLGARGVSVLFASGDDGVGAGECKVDDIVQFIPMFPASCPWVTSVGGTTELDPEIGASLSGGGFSFHFPRPDYQDEDVPAYIRHFGSKYEYNGFYNPNGRGIPDIAAQAVNCVTVVKGVAILGDGTSCAVPIAAGIISLLNDYQKSRGKPPLGFLNPWLYGEGIAGISDITFGSNPGCDTDGFSAVDGWDPVTGLGTPDFLELQDILRVAVTPTTSFTSSCTTSNSATSTPPTSHTPTAPPLTVSSTSRTRMHTSN